jgi:hypothetical protein
MKKHLDFNEDFLMNDFHKDILTGALFIIGLLGFFSGEFTISSALFGTAAIASNINLYRKKVKSDQLSCD